MQRNAAAVLAACLSVASCAVDDRIPDVVSSNAENSAGNSASSGASDDTAESASHSGSAGNGLADSAGPSGTDNDGPSEANPASAAPASMSAASSPAAPAGAPLPTASMPDAAPSIVQQIHFSGDGFGHIDVNDGTETQSCDASCQLSVAVGAHLTLTATAASLSRFVTWSSAPCASTATCAFDADAGTPLEVSFQLAYNVAFISDELYAVSQLPQPGVAANQECARLAATAGVHGTRWVAWLGGEGPTTQVSDDVTPTQFLQNPGGWVRTDGVAFARSRSALLAAQTLSPLVRSETRAQARSEAWSGTNFDGSIYRPLGTTAADCDNWTDANADAGGIAVTGSVGFYWMGTSGSGCGARESLLCFGDDPAPEVPLPPRDPNRRWAFLSVTPFSPASGIQSADAICQRDACNAGLTGSGDCATDLGALRTFRSYLHTSQQAAWERFDRNGPGWVRIDGMDWLPVASDLEQDATTALTAVNVQADGTFFISNDSAFWVGKPLSSSCCDDWTSSTANGGMGSSDGVGFPLSQGFPSDRACARAAKILCLQQ